MNSTENSLRKLPDTIVPKQPITMLAPMQDVTDITFMKAINRCGPPDYFVTEYFRVYENCRLDKKFIRNFTDNDTGRPVFAQLIGENEDYLERIATELQQYPVAGIDLNMGCPAPKVYKKNAGGGLLRDPKKIDSVLSVLRNCIPGLFTVKMRIGFENTEHFHEILDVVNSHNVDLLSLHGRTVKEMYRSEVHYDEIKEAVEILNCPVIANGDVTSAKKARWVLDYTGAAGVMVGRHAIRNPWMFSQIRDLESGKELTAVKLSQVYEYIENLYSIYERPEVPEKLQVNKMKKYLNFVGQSVDPEGKFQYEMRRTQTKKELFDVCTRHLLTQPDKLLADEPHKGVIARPNCE